MLLTMKVRVKVVEAIALLALFSVATAIFAEENEAGSVRWAFKAGGWVGSAPAIASDGTIYVGSRDKGLYALTPEGKVKWLFEMRGFVEISPAIARDGSIYVSNENKLYVLASDGKLKWTFKGGGLFSVPALAPHGTIYIGNSDNKLYALTPDGKLKWTFKMKSNVIYAPIAPAIGSDGTVYTGGGSSLYALSPKGEVRWSTLVERGAFLTAPLLASDGTIYIASNNNNRRISSLFAFTPEGKQIWVFEDNHGTPFRSQSPVIGYDGIIYYASAASLFAISPEGERKWEFHTGFVDAPPSIGADGCIYVVGSSGEVFAISPEGSLKWMFEMKARSSSSVSIGLDGTIYTGTMNSRQQDKKNENSLFAIRSASMGYAPSPWSSYQSRWLKHGGGQKSGMRPRLSPAPTESAAEGQSPAARELLQRGIPYIPERFIECAAVGDADCVRLFLKAGISPDVQDAKGGTALLRSLSKRHLAVARILLKMGANPDIQYKSGSTALMSAAQFGHLDAVKLLLEYNADTNIQDKFGGGTALGRAAYHNNIKIVKLLLEHGADPKISGDALRGACQNGHIEVVKLLLENGADVNARDFMGRTALSLARGAKSKNSDAIIELLRGAGKKR